VPIIPPDVAAPETLPGWLYQLAERYGGAEALVEPAGEARTFGELGQRVTALSEILAQAGVRRGGRVAYLLPNSAFTVEQFLAVTGLGAVSLGINTRSRPHDLRTVLRRAQPTHLIAARSFLAIDFQAMIAEALDGLEHRPAVLWPDHLEHVDQRGPGLPGCAQPRDLAVAFMTSGTTGTPKLPAHTHQHVVAHLRAAAQAARVGRDTTSLLVLPFCGTFGFVSAMSALSGGGRVVLPPRFTPASAAELIDRFGVTHVNGSDDMLIAITSQGATLTSWRHGVQAEFTGHGRQAVAAAEEHGARITGVYGSSETFALLTIRAPDKPLEQRWRAGGSFAADDMEARIAEAGDPTGASAAMGEIQFRGPSLPDAYLQAGGTAPPALTDDGWFCTGDLGHLDEDGGFTYVARQDDALRLAGFLVDPAEIERFLVRSPGVTQAQVVGVVKDDGHEVAVAFVTAHDTDDTQLLEYCRAGLANYKVPARIVIVDELPAVDGANGTKLTRSTLRRAAADLLLTEPA
jgi:acyl-CoA synthetase (AMP-forming)/AMP-acid ligase II